MCRGRCSNPIHLLHTRPCVRTCIEHFPYPEAGSAQDHRMLHTAMHTLGLVHWQSVATVRRAMRHVEISFLHCCCCCWRCAKGRRGSLGCACRCAPCTLLASSSSLLSSRLVCVSSLSAAGRSSSALTSVGCVSMWLPPCLLSRGHPTVDSILRKCAQPAVCLADCLSTACRKPRHQPCLCCWGLECNACGRFPATAARCFSTWPDALQGSALAWW